MKYEAAAQLVDHDPASTDPDLYKVIFENERVRVLEYRDSPGERTHPHRHPDSVMYTLSSFRRTIVAEGRQVDVDLGAGEVRWLPAQEHTGINIGSSPTHTLFIELKDPRPVPPATGEPLGPSA